MANDATFLLIEHDRLISQPEKQVPIPIIGFDSGTGRGLATVARIAMRERKPLSRSHVAAKSSTLLAAPLPRITNPLGKTAVTYIMPLRMEYEWKSVQIVKSAEQLFRQKNFPTRRYSR